MTITIGIDPHKATHTAVAVDTKEAVVGKHKVRASATQAATLIDWAQGFQARTWAVESAADPGYLVAQQLVAAGETVLHGSDGGCRAPGLHSSGSDKGEVGAALAVVGLSADRAAKEAQIRDDMICVARRSGASLRQLAEVSAWTVRP